MTFKHIDFGSSAVMRSLEKIAKEKGWMPQEQLKIAASKSDLSVSVNLVENILKLCEGLRNRGFDKFANELEKNFIIYKQAKTLYETSSEKGEDLIDSAHPKGSHKLRDIDSNEAVIETIIDQHLKNLKMIEKVPTGKYSSNKEILNAVKVVLASGILENELSQTLSAVHNLAQQVVNLTESELTISFSHAADWLDQLAADPKIDNIKKMKSLVSKQYGRLSPGLVTGVTEDTWIKVEPIFKSISNLLDKAIDIRRKIQEGKDNPEQYQVLNVPEVNIKASPLVPYFGQLTSLKNKINAWKSIGGIANNPGALQWINDELKALEKIYSLYTGSNIVEGQEINMIEPLKKQINDEVKDISVFENRFKDILKTNLETS